MGDERVRIRDARGLSLPLMSAALCGCASLGGLFGGGQDQTQAEQVPVLHFACESKGKILHYCDVETAAGVRLVKQVSDTPCIKGRTWGYGEHGVWVDKGCRGEFVSGAGDDEDPRRDPQGVVRCESEEQKWRRCNTEVTRQPPELLRRISDARCIEGDSWGWDAQGIWVDDGCRALFRVR